MKIKINTNLLYIYLLALLGLIIILIYFWVRFIRTRLPRQIPFELTLISFVVICFICLFYCYVLYRIYKPQKTLPIIYLFRKELLILLRPFHYFDKIIKKNKSISNIMFNFYYKTILYFNLCNFKYNSYIYIIFVILPKLILLSCFAFDVFFFNHLNLFYNIIFVGFIPLIYTYSLFSIATYLELISNKLDKNYKVIILNTPEEEEEYRKLHGTGCFMVRLSRLRYSDDDDSELDCKYFIETQAANLIFAELYQLYKYTCIETWFARETYIKKNKLETPFWVYTPLSDEISKALAKEFHLLMPQAFYFHAFLESQNDLVKKPMITYDKYFLIGYLICWLYILLVSIHTLDSSDVLNFLNHMKENIEPFSDLALQINETNET